MKQTFYSKNLAADFSFNSHIRVSIQFTNRLKSWVSLAFRLFTYCSAVVCSSVGDRQNFTGCDNARHNEWKS